MPGIWITPTIGPSRCGSLLPNDLGLFDMLGNVLEWCQDRNHTRWPDDRGPTRDLGAIGETVTDQQLRMARGGVFGSSSSEIQSAYHRSTEHTTYSAIYGGFRVARTLKDPGP